MQSTGRGPVVDVAFQGTGISSAEQVDERRFLAVYVLAMPHSAISLARPQCGPRYPRRYYHFTHSRRMAGLAHLWLRF